MSTKDGAEAVSPMDRVMEDICRELVRGVAAADRNENRELYDVLEGEYVPSPVRCRVDSLEELTHS